MGKMETLTACKIETLDQIDTQFVRIDYVHERNVCSKFGKNPFKGVKYNFLCDFFIFFFLGPTWRRDTWTDFDVQWLKRRGIAQGCAFLGLKK